MIQPKVRIVPVFKKGKGHESHVDGWVVHPDDRPVRAPTIAKSPPATQRKQAAKDLL